MKRIKTFLLAALLLASLAACKTEGETASPSDTPSASTPASATPLQPSAAPEEGGEATELVARFGYDGEAFTLYLEDNQTARDIARHVGSADWNLPIYHYDDFEGSEAMQYYDIPSRYEITNLSETVTSEKAGEVYYSEPNRIVLFYHDAEIEGEYTLVGHFDATDAFVDAVENNPVLEGWGNKIISISTK